MVLCLHNGYYAKLLKVSQCMKDKIRKVKRPHIHWNEVRIELGDPNVDLDFYRLLQKRPNMSKDRIAYNSLKKHYSTTALARYRWLGTPLTEECYEM